MSDDISEKFARPQIEAVLAVCEQPARGLLRAAAERALQAIESMCPAVMQPTDTGMAAAYGPAVPDEGLVVVVATSGRHVVLTADEWPEVEPLPEGVNSSEVWDGVAERVTAADVLALGCILSARLGDAGRADVAARSDKIRALGFTPVVVALAWSSGIKACGALGMVALPATIKRQLEMAAATKH
jgi:hypothetical protein